MTSTPPTTAHQGDAANALPMPLQKPSPGCMRLPSLWVDGATGLPRRDARDNRDYVSWVYYYRQVTVAASSYEDVDFDWSSLGLPRTPAVVPVVATANATLVRYGSIGLNVVESDADGCTVRIYNDSSAGSVSPMVRVYVFPRR